MASVGQDYVLGEDQHDPPILWMINRPSSLKFVPPVTDSELDVVFGSGRSQKIKSFGHDDDAVHWLVTRSGTDLHVDNSYARYSHHLLIRNDGMRIRGLSDARDTEDNWHPVMVPGVMYCLDTHSPHRVLHDPRLTESVGRGYKVQVAVDREQPLEPKEAWALLSPWLRYQVGEMIHTAQKTAPRVKK